MGLFSDFGRRDFLKASTLFTTFGSKLAFLGLWPRHSSAQEFFNSEAPFPIQQGMTDESTAQFSIVFSRKNPFRVQVTERSSGADAGSIETSVHSWGQRKECVIKVFVSGLNLGTEYVLTVTDTATQKADKRFFTTLDLNRSSIRFAVVACTKDLFPIDTHSNWKLLLERNPEVIFTLGDNVYADGFFGQFVSLDYVWARYLDTRQRLHLFRAKKLVPVLATWDDHDLGLNNADRTFPHFSEVRDIFHIFFAQDRERPSFTHGPGVSTVWNAFGQRFFLMDSRSGRSPGQTPLKDQTHWGWDQEEWLGSQLSKQAGPSWLMNGSQFFGGYHHEDSIQGDHPEAFKRLVNTLQRHAGVVVFASGDMHFCEIMRIPKSVVGYQTLEVTSSGVHFLIGTEADYWKKYPNPLQVAGATGENFTIVESMALAATGTMSAGLSLVVTSYGKKGRIFYARSETVARQRF